MKIFFSLIVELSYFFDLFISFVAYSPIFLIYCAIFLEGVKLMDFLGYILTF